MNDIYTMRTELANDFAVAGAKLLSFTATGGALAAIPETVPQQYAVAGTLESIQKVLSAAEPSHPQRRQRRGDRPAEPLSFDETAEPVIPAPRVEDPEGWQLVPKRATHEMYAKTVDIVFDGAVEDAEVIGEVYDAMLAGAPSPPIARQAQPTDRASVLEEAALAAESTDVATCGYWYDKQDDGFQTRYDIAAAIRALKGKSGSEGAAE